MIQTDLGSFSYKKGSLVPFCKRCGEQNFYLDGKNKIGLQKYGCKECGFRFVWTSDLERGRFFSSIVSFGVNLYADLRKGISLQGVAEVLQKVFDVSVSREAIRQWVLASTNAISRREIPKATCWHADETYIKIKGKGHWLWIVYDRLGVLAWHISKTRLVKDAKIVLKQALQIADTKPHKIITDGLHQYRTAIKKIIGWHWKTQKEKHIIDSGIGKNAPIERLNREIKRRIKWFSTFQSLKGAKAFFNNWFYNYNNRKPTHIT